MDIGSFATRLYVSDIDATEELLGKWYAAMPSARRQRCDRFRSEADRRRCIMAYALLVHALGDIGVSEGDIPDMREGADGKPFFEDIPVCFNISHAGERVAVAVSDSQVGCDVECRSDNALRVAKRFFAPEEYAFLESLEDEESQRAEFTKLWTMKESVIKCCGEGIRRVLSDFSVTDEHGNRKKTVTLPGKDERYHIKEFAGEGGYCYSVCTVSENIEDGIRRIRL
ncbi:MAG: 4'-phosphopantetheinyl transferase superfamily protein [Lachnospiraceae bacterium]|nr:4'-phosphopantetheinyl transferase superfamily protein [Lachnospiraceae bacterium]